jgi:hypothetical protein
MQEAMKAIMMQFQQPAPVAAVPVPKSAAPAAVASAKSAAVAAAKSAAVAAAKSAAVQAHTQYEDYPTSESEDEAMDLGAV